MSKNSMRAKMKITKLDKLGDSMEELSFTAVGKDGIYPSDGTDEDNTFALYTPSAELKMTINNPQLIDKYKEGDIFYVDFLKIN